MSVYTTKTNVTSILKPFCSADRERAKTAALNKVRFATPKEKGLAESVRVALEDGNFHLVQEFSFFLREADLCDEEVIHIMKDARKIVHSLTPNFASVVEALLSINWRKRSAEAIEAFTEFSIDIMVAHNTYIHIGISKLIVHWVPTDFEVSDWSNGSPTDRMRSELETVHGILNRILTAVPMSFDVVIEAIAAKFPYYKKSSYVTAGYLYNVLWLLEYKPVFEELVMQLVLQKLLILDVNAPRDEIDVETDDEEDDDDDAHKMEQEVGIFQMDDVASPDAQAKLTKSVDHPVGQTLDICLLMLYKFLDKKCRTTVNSTEEQRWSANRFFKMLVYIFDEVLLPSHNTCHVQFVIFQVCSIRSAYAEAFLSSLWLKVQNPNVSAVIRHAALGYMASFMARAKFVPLNTIKFYLKELSKWALTYIDDTDEYSTQNCSLKANMVFFSACQAMFYLIAFRAKHLTAYAKDLLFLQSLQLSRLAMCHYNPLRYCLPAVATAFSGITRTHQLAYCHTVLERNARRKLATVYGNDKAMAEETLETFFPFDPYLLKLSNKYIDPHYLVYKAHDMDESVEFAVPEQLRRKRGDSEMLEEDDFILADKRQKLNSSDLSRSHEFDKHFHYGSSPGFSSQIS